MQISVSPKNPVMKVLFKYNFLYASRSVLKTELYSKHDSSSSALYMKTQQIK